MSNFYRFSIHGKSVKNCLWTSIGSACCFVMRIYASSACYSYQELLTSTVIMTFLLSRPLMTKLINSKDFFKKVGIIFCNNRQLWFFESDNISSKVGITFFSDYIKNAILLENGFFSFTFLNKSSILSDL